MSRRATTSSGVPVAAPVIVWLGAAAPARSIRWLDGAIAQAAKFPGAVAVAAGEPTWLDLAADRATRGGIGSAGVPTDLSLDYVGWAQIVAAVARTLKATTILVDEASRPERAPEVAAIAELVDAPQLTRVVKLAPDGALVHCSRLAGKELQTIRVTTPAVIGIRIPGTAIEEYPTPMPSATMRRLELTDLGLDPNVLAHRALPPRAGQIARKTAERIADFLGMHRRHAPVRLPGDLREAPTDPSDGRAPSSRRTPRPEPERRPVASIPKTPYLGQRAVDDTEPPPSRGGRGGSGRGGRGGSEGG